MQIETLKLFCDVVRLRSISRGGAQSGVTQSAASQAIQQLETELDVQLLDRSRRPVQPTQEGRGFYEACRTLLAGFERARAELALGSQFNQKAFHDFILSQGLLPPEVLSQAVLHEFVPKYLK